MNSKLVVCAYHNVGYRCIETLLEQGAEIALIFTHDDAPNEEIWFSSVRELAEKNGIPWLTSDISQPENVERVRAIAPRFIFSFYYRNMIAPAVLEIPPGGAFNLHGSLLPRYRGRVPVNWAVINGETETGATLHVMVEKPDAGAIVDQERLSIEFTDTAHHVFDKITAVAVTVISRSWPLLRDGRATLTPMDLAEGSYFGGRRPADGLIRWDRSAVEIYNLVRGVTHPYPGAFTYLEGRKCLIWQAWPFPGSGLPGCVVSLEPFRVATGDGLLELRSLQLEDGPELNARDFVTSWNGPITIFQEQQ